MTTQEHKNTTTPAAQSKVQSPKSDVDYLVGRQVVVVRVSLVVRRGRRHVRRRLLLLLAPDAAAPLLVVLAVGVAVGHGGSRVADRGCRGSRGWRWRRRRRRRPGPVALARRVHLEAKGLRVLRYWRILMTMTRDFSHQRPVCVCVCVCDRPRVSASERAMAMRLWESSELLRLTH